MSVLPLSVQPATTARSSRSSRTQRIVILIAFLSAGWAIVAGSVARFLIVSERLDHADAIIVLSGAVTFEERAQLAAALYQEGRAPKIVLTNDNLQAGWSTKQQRNPFFWEYTMKQLRQSGVPLEGIEVLPQPVSGTYDEAVLLREYCGASGLRSIFVVTSAYHTRRALWTLRRVFEGSGISIGIAGVPPGQESPRPSTWWLYRRGWRMVAGEYLKMVYYGLRH